MTSGQSRAGPRAVSWTAEPRCRYDSQAPWTARYSLGQAMTTVAQGRGMHTEDGQGRLTAGRRRAEAR